MQKRLFLITVLILSLLLSHASKRKKNSENLPLCNTKWVLKELFNTPVTHHPDTAFIVFHHSYKLSGNFGCNLFFGEFNYGKKRLKIDYQGATKKYCFDMDLEENFIKAIKNDITHYYIVKDKLFLLSKNKVICKFEGIPLPIINTINEENIDHEDSN
jgi:heat shock protein HslJ